MTILIGFTYKKGNEQLIMLGSDSRITGEASETSAAGDVRKIVEIKFANGVALLAKAGMRVPANRFEEIFVERAAGKTISGPRDVANTAEDAMRELRMQLADRYPKELSLDQHFLDSGCTFMLAYFHGDQPYIYTIDLKYALAVRAQSKVTTLGCAAGLASFLLTGTEIDGQEAERVLDIAICTIELCKLHDAFCGGQVQLGMLDQIDGAMLWPNITVPLGLPEIASHVQKHQALVRHLSGVDKPAA